MRHPHRLATESYRGGSRYSLTTCTHRRRNYFTDHRLVDCVGTQLLRTARTEGFAVLAYCFMPDHLHVVVEGFDDTSNLPRFVRLAKQQTAYHFKRVTGERLWQDSYFDRTLRRDDDLGAMIRYVLDNPVRAGLVSTPMEYPHWGSQVTSRAGLLEFAGDCPRV